MGVCAVVITRLGGLGPGELLLKLAEGTCCGVRWWGKRLPGWGKNGSCSSYNPDKIAGRLPTSSGRILVSEEQKKPHNGLRGGCRHPIMSAAAAAAESGCDLFIFNIKAPRCSKPRGNINYHRGGRKGWKCCQAQHGNAFRCGCCFYPAIYGSFFRWQ